uniref:NB-ARC domain-containing protein n=1 Tax=Arundo donax TaxID=35708 RepID=A0A0A8XPM9_ARUDO
MAWFAAAHDVVVTATAVVSGATDWANFFQLIRPANIQQQNQAELLKEDLWRLRTSLPRARDLMDCAEWCIHKETVAELLSCLKDVVYDAEDIVDEFDYCQLERKLKQDLHAGPTCLDSMKNAFFGSISKVKEIQRRLEHLVCNMKEMGLHEELHCSGQSFRIETTSSLNESEIFCHQDEAATLIQLLDLPIKRKRTGNVVSMRESTNHDKGKNNNVSVLPIVGMGGVGKTTLVQQVCNDRRVKRYFGIPIWICVSYKFDEKKLAREFIRSATGEKMEVSDSMDLLQRKIRGVVMRTRFLLVLDDIWDDVCSNEGEKWLILLQALIHGLPGSMILVTTRSHKVAELVATTEHLQLDGLPDDTFWSFFKLCAFGSLASEINPELELIGRRIASKLKGFPLAAKTLGRLLSLRWDVEYWTRISECELWELPQNENDILPALRLSYQYLPSQLKRCFLMCALYPKDYMFEEESLICIWTASGLLERQGFRQSRDVGRGYLQELISQSFFQSAPGMSSKYVIHSLMHDMAQLVSSKEYCMIKDGSDLGKVPENIRHLSIFPRGNIDYNSLISLSRYKKLRSLVCCGDFESKELTPIVKQWFEELKFIRFLSFTCKLQEIPENIDNLKLLRYLGIASTCTFKTLPSSFCSLYNLQILEVPNIELLSLPKGFINLVNLERLTSESLQFCQDCASFDAAKGHSQGIRILTNIDQIRGTLKIENLEKVRSKAETAQALSNKKHLEKLTLNWKHRGQKNGSNMAVFKGGSPKLWQHRRKNGVSQTKVYEALPQPSNLKFRRHRRENDGSEVQVIEGLSPHANLKFLEILYYGGESMPNWLQPENLPNLRSLEFRYCDRFSSIQPSRCSRSTGDIIHQGFFPQRLCTKYLFLTSLSLEGCTNLSSIEEFLQPEYLPAIRILSVISCPRINWQRLLILPSSLEKLMLDKFGKFSDHFVSCLLILSSLANLYLSCPHLTSIPLPVWSKNLTSLETLTIHRCTSLASIGVPEASLNPPHSSGPTGAFLSLTELDIFSCHKLSSLDELLVPDYLPAIKRIKIGKCDELVSLPVEWFTGFPFLEDLEIFSCPRLGGQRGGRLALPSSLKRLFLANCGDISGWIPSCLHKLTSLMELWLGECPCITTIPGNLWSNHLPALKELVIWGCRDLTSIGGTQKIAHVKNVYIAGCLELEEFNQPFRKDYTDTLSLARAQTSLEVLPPEI